MMLCQVLSLFSSLFRVMLQIEISSGVLKRISLLLGLELPVLTVIRTTASSTCAKASTSAILDSQESITTSTTMFLRIKNASPILCNLMQSCITISFQAILQQLLTCS
jgi:hypothetical protein